MTESEVVELMRTSGSQREWNANCDRVKAAFGGQYPAFWFAVIVMSGIAGQMASRF